MNRDDAKDILWLYRRGTADAADPQIAEALDLVDQDTDLAVWFSEYGARQEALRARFREIPIPAGLKEQIVSEQMARERIVVWKLNVALAAAAAILMAFVLTALWLNHPKSDNTLAIYQKRMVGAALRGYAMDFMADNPQKIRAYLKKNGAPADYVLPVPLQRVALTGCAIESWQGTKVSMICFRTGKPLAPGEQSDLWLFVVDRSSVKNPPPPGPPLLMKVNELITATWTQGNQLYVLGTRGDEQTIRKLL